MMIGILLVTSTMLFAGVFIMKDRLNKILAAIKELRGNDGDRRNENK